MIAFSELDSQTQFAQQLREDDPSPVTLVNTFVVPEGKMDEVIAAFQKDSAIMKAAPGFISAQLYRGTGSSRVLVNVAVWESARALSEAFHSNEFQSTLGLFPDGTVAHPHLVQPMAVAGLCTA